MQLPLRVEAKQHGIQLDELLLVLKELDGVAVKGSHVFPITFSTLANVSELTE